MQNQTENQRKIVSNNDPKTNEKSLTNYSNIDENRISTWAHVGRQHGGNIEPCWLLNMDSCWMPTWSQQLSKMEPKCITVPASFSLHVSSFVWKLVGRFARRPTIDLTAIYIMYCRVLRHVLQSRKHIKNGQQLTKLGPNMSTEASKQ